MLIALLPRQKEAHTSLQSDVFRVSVPRGEFSSNLFSISRWWMHWKWRRREKGKKIFLSCSHFAMDILSWQAKSISLFEVLFCIRECVRVVKAFRNEAKTNLGVLITSPYAKFQFQYRNNLNCLFFLIQRRTLRNSVVACCCFFWIFHGAKKTTDQKILFKAENSFRAFCGMWNRGDFNMKITKLEA